MNYPSKSFLPPALKICQSHKELKIKLQHIFTKLKTLGNFHRCAKHEKRIDRITG